MSGNDSQALKDNSTVVLYWSYGLLFAGCVFGLLWATLPKKSSKEQGRKDSPPKTVLAKSTAEPTDWDFSEIKPLENFNWEETEEIPYRPFEAGPYFLKMGMGVMPNGMLSAHMYTLTKPKGLKTMPAENWIELDKTYLSRLDYKRQLFSQHRSETIQSLPGAEDASFEALEMLADFLHRRYPAIFEKTPQGIINLVTDEDWDLRRSSKVWSERKMHPLEVMSLLSTEDWVIMQKNPEGGDEYHLRAGAVCFPSGWRISERIGHSLYHIHAKNVPQYKARIAKPMDRFFTNLKVSSPVQRFNNSLEMSFELFHINPSQNLGAELSEKLTIGDIFLRVERQTLRRLPQSRALLFGIRTYITPVETVAKDREVAKALRGQIDAYPEDFAGYKNKHVWKVAVVEHLDGILQM